MKKLLFSILLNVAFLYGAHAQLNLSNIDLNPNNMNKPLNATLFPDANFREEIFTFDDATNSWKTEYYLDLKTNNHRETHRSFTSLNANDIEDIVTTDVAIMYNNTNKVVQRFYYERKVGETSSKLVAIDSFYYADDNVYNLAYFKLNSSDEWEQQSSILYNYDNEGRFVEASVGYLMRGETSYKGMRIHEFDSEDRPISISYYKTEADAETGIRTNSLNYKAQYVFDAKDRIVDSKAFVEIGGEYFFFLGSVAYASGEKSYPDSTYMYSYDQQDSTPSSKTTYTFNANNKLDEIITQNFENGAFKNSRKQVYSKYTAGVRDVNNKMDIVIYPNPSNGSFSLLLPEFKSNLSFEVYNLIGEKLLEGTSEQAQVNLNTSLKQGTYFLKIKADNKIETRKLIIK